MFPYLYDFFNLPHAFLSKWLFCMCITDFFRHDLALNFYSCCRLSLLVIPFVYNNMVYNVPCYSGSREPSPMGGDEAGIGVRHKVLCTGQDEHEVRQWLPARPDHL